MSINLKVKSFQSIKDSEVEIEGFTVITGPNNEGKSALVRSIKGLFSNYTGSQHGWVRNGCEGLSVEMSFSDGGRVLWERGPKHSRYEVNDECLENAGQYVPDELDALGVKPLKLGRDTKIWPQIADQFSQVFLLNESGAIFAEAIADVERVGKINKSLRQAESDRKAASSKLKIRNSDIREVEDQIEALKPLNKAKRCYNKANKCRNLALSTQKEIEFCKSSQVKIQEFESDIKDLEGIYHIDLPEDSSISSISSCNEMILFASKSRTQLKRLESFQERTSFVEEIDIPSIESIPSRLTALSVIKSHLSSLRRLDDVLNESVDLNGIHLPEGESFSRCNKISAMKSQLEDFKSNLTKASRAISLVDQEISNKEASLRSIEDRVSEILGDLEFCPTCGQECSSHDS